MSNLFSTDNETAVLGILLANPEKIYELRRLKPFMMSAEPSRLLLETILELTDKDTIPNIDLIINFLTSKNSLEKVGGTGYLFSLKSMNYPADNLKEYERLVVDAYKGSKVLELSSEISSLVRKGDVDSTIKYISDKIANLTLENGFDTTQSVNSILDLAYPEILRKINTEDKVFGTPFGIKNIDDEYGGVFPGEVWIIASRPSIGKSAIMCNSALKTAQMDNPVLIFSYEMSKQSLIERMLSIETELGVSNLRLGTLRKSEVPLIEKAVDDLKQLPIHIDTNYTGNINYTLTTIRKYHRLYGIKLVYIDYLQLLSERTENATNELGQISRAFKLLANDLGIGFILFSQLNRLVELRDDKRPILSDLRQSGDLEQDSDVVAMLYRDEYYNSKTEYPGIMEFIVRKNRNGPPGVFVLSFNGVTNKITPATLRSI